MGPETGDISMIVSDSSMWLVNIAALFLIAGALSAPSVFEALKEALSSFLEFLSRRSSAQYTEIEVQPAGKQKQPQPVPCLTSEIATHKVEYQPYQDNPTQKLE